MTAETFAYWLKGHFELNNSDELTPQQVKIIKEHLNLVFNKVTPNIPLDNNLDNDFKELSSPYENSIDWTLRPDQLPKYFEIPKDFFTKIIC